MVVQFPLPSKIQIPDKTVLEKEMIKVCNFGYQS